MPRIDTDGLDELCRQMDKDPERAEKRIDAMLIAGAQAVKAGWQKSAEENRFRRTGALIGHIDYTKKVKKMGDLKYIEKTPSVRDMRRSPIFCIGARPAQQRGEPRRACGTKSTQESRASRERCGLTVPKSCPHPRALKR